MERDDLIIELARAIRPYLPELLGDRAQEKDRELADLLADLGTGGDTDRVRRAILETLARDPATHNWGGEFLATGRPPGLQQNEIRTFEQVAGHPVPPSPLRYVCPKGNDFTWYRRVVGERPPRCETHGIDLEASGEGEGGSDNERGGVEHPEPATVTRVLRVEFPTRVRTGVSLILIATIGEQPVDAANWSELRAVKVGSPVMLTCSATGFDLRSEMQVTVVVPASGDSDPAPFELVAADPGLQTITMRAFAGSSYLGGLSIQVTVDSAGRTEQSAQHFAELSRRDWQQGEVTLEIEYDEDKKIYAYRWRDGTFVPDVCIRNDEQLRRTPIDVVDGIVQGLNSLARGTTGYSPESARDWLKNQGIGLWQSFFPNRLQAQFRENWDKITRLSIISKNDMIPWELLYASDQEGELGYLAERFPIARLPQGGVPADLLFASADFVRPPRDSPAAAAKEVEAIGDILSGRGVDVHAPTTDLDSLRGLLATGGFSLLHFASHNSFSRTPPFDRITLGRAAFDPSFLNQYTPRSSFRSSSPLVFINACGSDRRTPVYTRLGGWADAFLGAGAGAFVGSLWEVRDSSSLSFATAFYTALAEGKTVGESIAAARQKLRSDDPSDPTWLAYSLWGDPAARVRLGGGA